MQPIPSDQNKDKLKRNYLGALRRQYKQFRPEMVNYRAYFSVWSWYYEIPTTSIKKFIWEHGEITTDPDDFVYASWGALSKMHLILASAGWGRGVGTPLR